MKTINSKYIVLIGVLFVSFASIFIKLSSAHSLIIATYRMLFTVIILLPITFKKKVSLNIDKKTMLLSILSGLFLALHFGSWISSLKYTSVANSTVLVTIHPIFIVIISYFLLKEKVSYKMVFSILITILGSIITSLSNVTLNETALYGNFLAVLGALFMSLYIIIGKVVRKTISSTTYTFIVYLTSTIVLFIFSLLNSLRFYPYPINEWIIFIALAFFCTILGHSIFNWALKFESPQFISISILLEPVLASIWGLVFLLEIPTFYNVLGGFLVLTGIVSFMRFQVKDGSNKISFFSKKQKAQT